MSPPEVQPGDLLATRSGGWAGMMIRLGSAFRDQPNLHNHIAIVTHTDGAGTTWCVEGRPGGFGWKDAASYLNSKWTVHNRVQPKTLAQRHQVMAGAREMVGADYDWLAIAHDAAGAFGLDKVWKLKWGKDGEVPGQVVCSSAAAYLYAKAGLDHPGGDREVTPADWTELWVEKGWARRVGA